MLILIMIAALMSVILYKNLGLMRKLSRSETHVTMETNRRHNCDEMVTYCFDDADCNSMCAANGPNKYECSRNNFECHVKKTSTVRGTQKECNKKHGFLRVFSTNELMGTTSFCLPTLTNIYDSEDNVNKFVCNGGILQTDITKNPFDVKNCVCNPPKVLAVMDNSSTVPRCVDPLLIELISTLKRVL